MNNQESIGHKLASTNNLIGQFISESMKVDADTLSPIQVRIIKYLFLHKEDRVYQRDIENLFSIRRSTVTGIIKNMEKNGIVYREISKNDNRMKIIYLTNEYINKGREIVEGAKALDDIIEKDFSDYQKKMMLSLLHKIQKNLIEERNKNVKNI